MATFPELDFDRLRNEAGVREEVIRPLLDALGYRACTEYDVIYELPVSVRVSLGREKDSDPVLYGRPDYMLEIRKCIRWVIEAKAPTAAISEEDISQACTYARVPRIDAALYAICNGRELQVFDSRAARGAPPVLHVQYEELGSRYRDVYNVLSPEAMERRFRDLQLDFSRPVGPGFPAQARITGGVIEYDSVPPGAPGMRDLRLSIVGGAVQRGAGSGLVAWIEASAPTRPWQSFNERLGLKSFDMVSADHALSTDASKPTVFRYSKPTTFPAGTVFPRIPGFIEEEQTLLANVTVHITVEAAGSLTGHTFAGNFETQMRISARGQSAPVLISAGPFEVHLV
jgi:hypothetical protein